MIRGGEAYVKLGQDAARDFIENEIPLVDAIAKVAMKLEEEQVQRVCEAANHAVNASLLKSAEDSTSRYTEFDLADKPAVLAKIALLKEAALRPDDYQLAPSSHFPAVTSPAGPEKQASSQEEASLLSILENEDTEELDKKAELTLNRLVDTRRTIISKIAEVEVDVLLADREVDKREDELYSAAKTALLGGEKLEDVKTATLASLDGMTDSEQIWSDIFDRMKSEGLVYTEDLSADGIDTDVMVDEGSDLYKAASRLRQGYRDHATAQGFVDALEQQVVGLNENMRKVAFFQGLVKKQAKKAIKPKNAVPKPFRTKSDNVFDAVFAAMGPEKTMAKTRVI